MKGKKFPRSPVLRIDVTAEALKHAVARNSGHCWIADSVKAQVPWATKVSVDLQTIRMTDLEKGLRYAYLTPRQCQVALVMFDQGRRSELHPFTFTLRRAQIARAQVKAPPSASAPAAGARSSRAAQVPKGATLVNDSAARKRGHRPRRIGGRLPPRLSASNRREFGIRALSIGYPADAPEKAA